MSESDMEIKHVNGSMIRVDGLDDQDRVDKILGTEYGHIFFNESTQLSWPTVTTVLTRLAQNVPGLVARKAIFDCNPKSQRHWLYKVGVMNVDPDTGHKLLDADTWYRQSFTPYDNPYLPADALATLESLTGTQRRRMLEGVWCESEGAVYDEFDEELHVYSETPKGFENWSLVCGVDFGYTNPFVHLWGRLDHDGRLYIFREHYKAGMTVNEHAGVIKQFERERDKSWTVADHDAEDRATLHQHGIFTRAANKDVAAGINAVKSLLAVQSDGKPRLMIHASCRNLIGEFLDYTWEPPRENRNAKEVPIKDRDHALDALRYMVMQLKRPQPSLVV
jgi:phage terminase large subunit